MDLARDALGSSKEAMRDIGYRTVDLLVDQMTDATIPAMRAEPVRNSAGV